MGRGWCRPPPRRTRCHEGAWRAVGAGRCSGAKRRAAGAQSQSVSARCLRRSSSWRASWPRRSTRRRRRPRRWRPPRPASASSSAHNGCRTKSSAPPAASCACYLRPRGTSRGTRPSSGSTCSGWACCTTSRSRPRSSRSRGGCSSRSRASRSSSRRSSFTLRRRLQRRCSGRSSTTSRCRCSTPTSTWCTSGGRATPRSTRASATPCSSWRPSTPTWSGSTTTT
mmetsp:Transcript_33071/g.105389  ORF Transcript_33071/g.105389 Transcript_33071/m.105389 type:complete len:225 (-) Transcript_33071:3323-3997(-)